MNKTKKYFKKIIVFQQNITYVVHHFTTEQVIDLDIDTVEQPIICIAKYFKNRLSLKKVLLIYQKKSFYLNNAIRFYVNHLIHYFENVNDFLYNLNLKIQNNSIIFSIYSKI